MNLKIGTIILTLAMLLSGCYLPIRGRVVDAETGAPIEGAVVLVEWTKRHGIGDHWTESYKVVEALTGKEGKVRIEGCYSPFVEPPDMAIYKKGYVAWSNKWIFPEGKNRTDFTWADSVFKLESFRGEYSYDAHASFILLMLSGPLENKNLMLDATKWEMERAFEERRLK